MNSKKMRIIIIVFACAFAALGRFLLWVIFTPTIDEDEFKGFTYKTVESLEYGYYQLSDFVEGVTCDEVCRFGDEVLSYKISDAKSLGANTLRVTLDYRGKYYEETFEVNITDTTEPYISLIGEEIEIVKNSPFDAMDYLYAVEDNFSSLQIGDIEITGKVDTKKVGNYEVFFSIEDESGNKASSSLVVHVVAKEEDKKGEETKPAVPTKPTTSSANNKVSVYQPPRSTLRDMVNAQGLSPLYTRFPEVDNRVGGIVSSVAGGGKSNYDKLIGIYDYVKSHVSYQTSFLNAGTVDALVSQYHYTIYDATQLAYAKYSLDTGTGICWNYAALFTILARRVGFEAYVVTGHSPNQVGGRGDHAWTAIRMNGKFYFFDPQIENFRQTGYMFFAVPEDEKGEYYSDYSVYGSMSKFNFFREQAALQVQLGVSGAATASHILSSHGSSSAKDAANVTVGSKISFSMNFQGYNQYNYQVSVGNVNIKSGTSSGEAVAIEYAFEEEGATTINITVSTSGGMKVTYSLVANVTDPNKIRGFSSYSAVQTGTGVELSFVPVGGVAPYSYKIDISDTDATGGYGVDYSNPNHLFLIVGDGTHFKLQVTVKDQSVGILTRTFNYDVTSNSLTLE